MASSPPPIPSVSLDSPFSDRWRVVRELGRGSFSTVVLAELTDADGSQFPVPPGLVAAKLFGPGEQPDLDTEIRVLSALAPVKAELRPAPDAPAAASASCPAPALAGGLRRRRRLGSGSAAVPSAARPVMTLDQLVESAGARCVVRAFGVERTPEESALLLEPCLGGDLRDYINARYKHSGRARAGGLVTEAQARVLGFHLACGIAFCHGRGVAVRDIKPENVLIAADGSVRLSDFGLSAAGCCGATAGCRLVSGTTAYMAPEGLARINEPEGEDSPAAEGDVGAEDPADGPGPGEHGTAVDWWALGATLFELMLGVPPMFEEGIDATEHARRIVEDKVEFPPWARDEESAPDESSMLSSHAASLLLGLLAKDPRSRLGAGPEGAAAVLRHPFFGRGAGVRERLAGSVAVDFDADGARRWLPGLAGDDD